MRARDSRSLLRGAFLALAAALPAAGVPAPPPPLPAGPAPKALAFPHFPDRAHAFIWRNWSVAEPARLAQVLGTPVGNVLAAAESMGLPPARPIPPEQSARIYVTTIRRNWHLLSYDQLLVLLDLSAEQLAYTLREDDFLYIKLGSLKPDCPPMRYTEPTAEARERAAAIRRVVEETFGAEIREPGQPRFGFVEAFRRADSTRAPPPAPAAGLRFIYSYFGLFGDPLADRDQDPYPDGLLQRLRELGINGIWMHAVLRTLAPSATFPEFGDGHAERLANLRRLVDRARAHGIAVYLYMNEPRAMPAGFFANRPGLRGAREGDHHAMCTSVPEVRKWVEEALAHVFRSVPGLGGVFTISASENLTHCASHGRQGDCPRCRLRKPAEIVAEANAAVEAGVHRGSPGAEVIVWDWGWGAWAGEAIARLPKSVSFMSVSEWSKPIVRGGIETEVGEYSLSAVGPGPRAAAHWALARQAGLKTVAKVQVNNTWELSAVPYLPVLDLVAEHCGNLAAAGVDGLTLSWSLGGYPSPNLEVASRFSRNPPPAKEVVLDEVARARFGPDGAPHARKAWTAFSDAFREFPFHIGVLYTAPQQFGPANLLFAKPTGYRATMVGFPYDDVNAWRGPYPAGVFADQFDTVAAGWKAGLADLERAVAAAPPGRAGDAQAELRFAEAAQLHFRSVANQVRFTAARDALLGKDGALDPVPRKARVGEMRRALEDEVQAARRLFTLTRQDSRIGMEMKIPTGLLLCPALLAVPAAAVAAPRFATVEVAFDGQSAPLPSASSCGFSLVAAAEGPQAAFASRPPQCVVAVRKGEQVVVTVGVQGAAEPFTAAVEAELFLGAGATVVLSVDDRETRQALASNAPVSLELSREARAAEARIRLAVSGLEGEAGGRLRNLRLTVGQDRFDVPLALPTAPSGPGAPPVLPAYRPAVEQALVEWDWRMQDGIGTEREPATYAAAVALTLRRGVRLMADLRATGVGLDAEARQCGDLLREAQHLSASDAIGGDDRVRNEAAWEGLWRRAHALRRRIALANPLVRGAPVAFVKQVPGAFSHQLTQYYGRYARPGGGVFVLERPGDSMACRPLTAGRLPEGSCQHLDVSFDADRLLFSFCPCDAAPADGLAGHRGRYYHLYEVAADSSALRELTTGPFDDFAPRHLPDGRIVFISTRRQGWHRCGHPGCENYTLAFADAGGANPRPISCHETQEWDPAVLNDGRIAYTRWDYVDRHAVYYEQLWTVRTDGSGPAAFYGNNTFNPVGTWEPRAVPGSHRVMATAAAHHAMTAGSIVLVDPDRGVDGLAPLTRLTPDAPFPESETALAPHWRGPVPVEAPPAPVEARRWPGHSYRSPYPLSETYFLAAYGFDPLVGEPEANAANLFGLYLVDVFGNKELLYRDLNVASAWPAPLRPRLRPPVVEKAVVVAPDGGNLQNAPPDVEGLTLPAAASAEGVYFVQDVYAADPALPLGSVKRLRVVQVLPKSTPGINNPPVGLANASPGKQVLGTVPVEADGSAFFRAPSGVPLSFQALDGRGQAVQIMRSVSYLQPGEVAACVGCHEHRMTAPPAGTRAAALARAPSAIRPGPEGSRPLSYPILVQPVLDRKCVGCHRREDPQGDVILTGEPQGRFTASYNAMAARVPFPQWTGGDFRTASSEPLSRPGFFGARGSPIMRELLKGHKDVTLDPDEVERLATWMDANALFYGTFDPAGQARQRRGERIEGPGLE